MAVLNFSINVPDANQVEILDAFVRQNGWVPTLPDGTANPETKVQASRRIILEFIKNSYKAFKVTKDAKVATDASAATADATVFT